MQPRSTAAITDACNHDRQQPSLMHATTIDSSHH
jgi:hypothetical protein